MNKSSGWFDKTIKDNWEYPVLDGVTDALKYYNTTPKILWVLKEPDKSDEKEVWNHRDFHKNVACYNKWKCTYKRIIYCSYGIINRIRKWDSLPEIENDSSINKEFYTHKIAIINVNKSGGGSVSNQRFIRERYQKKKDILMKQIYGINPDIIINCSSVYELFMDLTEKLALKQKHITFNASTNIEYSNNKEKMLINYFHPNARNKGMTDKNYCNGLLRICNNWK